MSISSSNRQQSAAAVGRSNQGHDTDVAVQHVQHEPVAARHDQRLGLFGHPGEDPAQDFRPLTTSTLVRVAL